MEDTPPWLQLLMARPATQTQCTGRGEELKGLLIEDAGSVPQRIQGLIHDPTSRVSWRPLGCSLSAGRDLISV